ncbi:NIL domain-containing protein, partial [Streptococcus mutans]|nr:NIL domain-containing protein [Streptococcus mutans]
GNIEILEKTPVGEMIVILEGAATNIDQALNDLTHSDLTVMVLKRGV